MNFGKRVNHNRKRIVWAINPFSDEKTYFGHALEVIGDFAADSGAEVEPVYVLAPPNLILPVRAVLSLLEPTEPKLDTLWKKLTKGINAPVSS